MRRMTGIDRRTFDVDKADRGVLRRAVHFVCTCICRRPYRVPRRGRFTEYTFPLRGVAACRCMRDFIRNDFSANKEMQGAGETGFVPLSGT